MTQSLYRQLTLRQAHFGPTAMNNGADFDQPVAGPKPESAWADNQMNTSFG